MELLQFPVRFQLGTSPLHFAAQHGHLSTAEVLLRAGISRDARTKVDRTPLHVACQEGHIEIVDLLIRSGADVEAKDMVSMFQPSGSIWFHLVPAIDRIKKSQILSITFLSTSPRSLFSQKKKPVKCLLVTDWYDCLMVTVLGVL